jgi:hypothetical protein
MGVREAMNRNKPLAIAATLLAVGASVGFALLNWASGPIDPMAGTGQAYYSVDDGKTYFVASSANVAPFDHQGKPAVQAQVYTADGGKTKFVGYLMRFTPKGVEKMKAMRAGASARRTLPGLDPELQENTEVKKPGAPAWVKLSNVAAAAEVMTVRVPGDPTRLADPIDP